MAEIRGNHVLDCEVHGRRCTGEVTVRNISHLRVGQTYNVYPSEFVTVVAASGAAVVGQ